MVLRHAAVGRELRRPGGAGRRGRQPRPASLARHGGLLMVSAGCPGCLWVRWGARRSAGREGRPLAGPTRLCAALQGLCCLAACWLARW